MGNYVQSQLPDQHEWWHIDRERFNKWDNRAMPRKKKTRLFLSYSHEDRDIVLQVALKLESSGIGVWLDRWELRAGDSIFDKIDEGIGISDYLAVFLSPASLRSKWVRSELKAGFSEELDQMSVSVLVVLLPNCHDKDVPRLLRDKVRIDFRTSFLTGISDFLEAFRQTKKASDLLFEKGTQLMQNGYADEAIPILRDALEKYPAHYSAMHNLAVAYANKEKYDDALSLFKTLVTEQPNTAIYKSGLGVTLVKKGLLERGLKELRESVSMAPNDYQIRFYVGKSFLEASESFRRAELYREAAAEFETILQHDPENIWAWYYLGQALSGLFESGETDKNQKAIEAYRKVIATEPDFADAFNNYGTALMRSGNLKEAVMNWEKAILLQPRKPHAHRNLARAYFYLGRVSDSLIHFKAALSIDPSDVSVQYDYSKVLSRMGRKEDAIREYYKVLDLDPNHIAARTELAMVLRSIPAMEQAIGELSKVELQAANEPSLKKAKSYFALMDMADSSVKMGFTGDTFNDDILDAIKAHAGFRVNVFE